MSETRTQAIRREVKEVETGLYVRTISGREFKAFVQFQKANESQPKEELNISNVYQLLQYAASDKEGHALFDSFEAVQDLPIPTAMKMFEAAAKLNGLSDDDAEKKTAVSGSS
jgi:5-methylcytosine-specific restriction endonuclease McrBC regulatory subunit McrC